jgi:serine/threonine protein kinase
MSTPIRPLEFVELIQKSGVVELARLDTALVEVGESALAGSAGSLAKLLIGRGILTPFQADQLLHGRWRGFVLGKYVILERLAVGGMGIVYLGEHRQLRRRVAIKVLPLALAQDPWFVEQFYREAQAIALLDHPNIIRAHDVDRDNNLHFLVMEYVDGASLHDIVSRHGSMEPLRAAHYIRQAALGLQHAHEAGLVHRDIKPGNLLLTRQGLVKILDLGLARLFRELRSEALEQNRQEYRMVGTDDYLAPEQVIDSDKVDIRADIYSLGATFYFLLSARPPFEDAAEDLHKLIGHVTRRPKPVREIRPEVPEGIANVMGRMMAKNPWERFQTPGAVAQALASWTRSPILPPPEAEMPEANLARTIQLHDPPSSAVRGETKTSWVICMTPPDSPGESPTETDGTSVEIKQLPRGDRPHHC